MEKFTIFGGRGFIGREFVKMIAAEGHDVYVPYRNDSRIYSDDLGTVIYCAGYGDCEKDPFNVLNANVTLLSSLLEKSTFDKLIYISSTRVYMNQDDSHEHCDIIISSEDNRKLFNLTKLVSEELCAKSNRNCLVIRPSNVFGLALNSTLFLPSITKNAILNNQIDMYVDKGYAKDYICVSDLVQATLQISRAHDKKNKVINVASGKNTKAIDIANVLQKETGCNVVWHEQNKAKEKFPITNVDEMRCYIDFKPIDVITALNDMICEFKRELKGA